MSVFHWRAVKISLCPWGRAASASSASSRGARPRAPLRDSTSAMHAATTAADSAESVSRIPRRISSKASRYMMRCTWSRPRVASPASTPEQSPHTPSSQAPLPSASTPQLLQPQNVLACTISACSSSAMKKTRGRSVMRSVFSRSTGCDGSYSSSSVLSEQTRSMRLMFCCTGTDSTGWRRYRSSSLPLALPPGVECHRAVSPSMPASLPESLSFREMARMTRSVWHHGGSTKEPTSSPPGSSTSMGNGEKSRSTSICAMFGRKRMRRGNTRVAFSSASPSASAISSSVM
mmetsp:Transcript_5154/g.14653  ORF Transcript_5154/g.14653 Transcript_5154/m.14653 type:complete len:290 (-) Transcript_5154:58-927(-)